MLIGPWMLAEVGSESHSEPSGTGRCCRADEGRAVYGEVNAFKHDPQRKAAGRTVSMNDALLSFGRIMQILSDQKTPVDEPLRNKWRLRYDEEERSVRLAAALSSPNHNLGKHNSVPQEEHQATYAGV
jgi:hypothetical protein